MGHLKPRSRGVPAWFSLLERVARRQSPLRQLLSAGARASQAFGPGIILASLVSQVAAGNVNSSWRVYRGLGDSLLLAQVG